MSTEKKAIKWAILTTGWGRNAKDIIEVFSKNGIPGSEISLLIYQSMPCGAATAAAEAGIESRRILRSNFESSESYQYELTQILISANIDYIFLLSFKYIIRETMLKAFPERIVNIHPSLFPSFLATTKAIQEALDYGVKVSGITTHLIDDQIDQGIILCQEPIRFDDNETFESVYPKFAAKSPVIILRTMEKIRSLKC